jgi:ethanolamine utilization protein EutN
MDMARVIGNVVATQKDPSLEGYKICILQPMDEHRQDFGEPLIAIDVTNQAGLGETVFFVTGGDAIQLEEGKIMPSDAAVAGIIDSWSLLEGNKE